MEAHIDVAQGLIFPSNAISTETLSCNGALSLPNAICFVVSS